MKKPLKFLFKLIFITIILLSLFVGWIFMQIPSDKEIRGCMTTKMYQVHLCPGSKNYVPLHQISTYLQKTVILTEDSAFYTHKGFDWDAIEKSARENWQKGTYKRGGSTISQQLAKNMFLSKEKTLMRKAIEGLITYRIENTLKKKEILERYLNVVEFGKNIYGIKAAASFYFKKSAAELNVVESAFLAMLLPSPVKYSKSFFSKELSPFAKKRINRIINDLYQYNRISLPEYEIAMMEVDGFLSAGSNLIDPDSSKTNLDDLDLVDEEDSWFY